MSYFASETDKELLLTKLQPIFYAMVKYGSDAIMANNTARNLDAGGRAETSFLRTVALH